MKEGERPELELGCLLVVNVRPRIRSLSQR